MDKIRHEIKPEFIYSYLPYVEQVDLPDFADVIAEQHSVTAAVTNTLVARFRGKNGEPSYQEVLRFKVAQGYDIKEARRDNDALVAPRRPFGDIDMELDLTPSTVVAFYVRNRLNINSGRWEKANYDLKMTDTRGDTATIGYHYTADLLDEINLSFRAFVTKSLNLSYELRRNLFDGQDISNIIGFNYSRQCWSVGLSLADAASDRTVMLFFSLNGLGGVGKK